MYKLKRIFTLQNCLLMFVGIGVWMLVLQNLGVITIVQKVEIEGGYVSKITEDVKVKGNVDANVNNTVDMNIHSINGQQDVFFNDPARGHHNKYYKLPIAY